MASPPMIRYRNVVKLSLTNGNPPPWTSPKGTSGSPVKLVTRNAAASAARATMPADSRSSLITSALSIDCLRSKNRKRAAWPARVFDECVFEIEIEDFDRNWCERFDGFALGIVVANEDHFERIGDLAPADQAGNARRIRRPAGEFEDQLAD